MSLILEALKKSEARRRLGEAPDLETPFAAKPQRRSLLPLILIAIVVVAGIGWWSMRTPSAPAGAVSTPAPAPSKPVAKPLAAASPAVAVKPPSANPPPLAAAPAPSAPAPVASAKTADDVSNVSQWVPVGQGSLRTTGVNRKRANPAANPVDTMPAPAAASKPPVAAASMVTQNPVAAATPPAAVKKLEPVVQPVPVAELKKPEPPPAVASGAGLKKQELAPEPAVAAGVKKPEPSPTAAAGSSAQPYYELPFSVRKDLPAIKLSMHVYAPEPAQRFIILNDSRMVEGNSQDDLALREIRPDGAVFEFKGQRFFYPRDGL